MKYVYAMTMLMSLIAVFLLIQLGFGYRDEGYGLHPAIALAGSFCCLMAGLYASSCLADIEHHDY